MAATMNFRGVSVETQTLSRDKEGAGYALAAGALRLQRLFTDQLGMRPTEAAVYLTIVLAAGGSHDCEASRRPRHGIGPISRRAVAAATGLPRETVRRIIDKLLETRLIATAGETPRHGGLVAPGADKVVAMLAAEADRLFETLASVGAGAR